MYCFISDVLCRYLLLTWTGCTPVQKFLTFRKFSVVWICLVFIPLICFLLFFMNQNDWSCFRCSSISNVHISFLMFGPSSGYDVLVILHCEATCFQCQRAAAAGERYGVLPSTSKVCDQGSRGFGREWVSLNTRGWDFLLDDFNLNFFYLYRYHSW